MNDNSYQLESESGINIKKLDKACLVFNVESENGYRVSILDKTNSTEAVYWTTDFLGLEQCEDNYFQTSNYLKLCKDFVQEVYNQENDIPKADQIDMLNRSIDYFKKADTFNENLFKEEVVSDPQIIDAFENFKNYYEEKNELALKDQFDVSNSAVKDEKRYSPSLPLRRTSVSFGGKAAKGNAPPGQGGAAPLRGPEGQSPSAGSGAEPRKKGRQGYLEGSLSRWET